jgi:hypothetical protein
VIFRPLNSMLGGPQLPPGLHSFILGPFFATTSENVTTPWSNGAIEGHINRLKALKRQMYGRAGFELLKARMLPWETSNAV